MTRAWRDGTASLVFFLAAAGFAHPVLAQCTLTCTADVIAGSDTDQCGTIINYAAPTPTGCVGTVACIPPSGGVFPVGDTIVTCMDSASGASCSFTVTVADVIPPLLTCPADQTVPPVNAGGALVNFTPTASDNCPGVITSCDPPSGSIFPVGTTADQCMAVDASGNSAACSFAVNVQSLLEVPTLSARLLAALAAVLALSGYLMLRRR